MIIRYIRWAQNLRCPVCDDVQPVFGLLSTLRGGLANVAMNDFAICATCSTKLKVVHKMGRGFSILIQAFIQFLIICLFLAVAVPLFFHGFVGWGLWFLPVGVFLLPLFQLIGLLPLRFLGPYYREVVVA